jgi:hypothetical protein
VPLQKAVADAGKRLADQADTRMQTAGGLAGIGLQRALQAAAAASPTPQARIVAQSVTISPEGITIGGGRPVGSRGTSAGAILWGSERGGVNFDAPAGGAYWIAPAVDRYSQSGADGPYLAAVNGILHDCGLL